MATTQSLNAKVRETAESTSDAPRARRGQPSRLRTLVWYVVVLGLLGGGVAGAKYGLNKINSTGNETGPSTSEQELDKVIVSGHVDVPRGTTDVRPQVPGQVVKLLVDENVPVSKGTPLFELDATDAKFQLELAKRALAEAELQRKQLKEQEKELPKAFVTKIARQQAKIEVLELQRDGLKERLETIDDLLRKGIGKKSDKTVVESLIKTQEKAIDAERKLIPDIRETERQQMIQLAQAIEQADEFIKRLKLQVDRAQHAVDLHLVSAPYDGFVLRRMINVGDMVGPGSPIPALTFCSNDPVIIRAEVDQEWAHFVADGVEVTIQDDARQGWEWKGRVKSLSHWFEKRRSGVAVPRQLNDVRTMESIIEVTEQFKDRPLRIGQRVRVIVNR